MRPSKQAWRYVAAAAAVAVALSAGEAGAASNIGRAVAKDVAGGLVLGASIGTQAGLIPYGQHGNHASYFRDDLVLRAGYGSLIGAGAGFFVGLYEARLDRPVGTSMGINVFGGQLVGSVVGGLGASISYLRTDRGSDFTSGIGVGGLAGAAVGIFLTFYEGMRIQPGAQPFMGKVVGTDVAAGILAGAALGASGGMVPYGMRGNSRLQDSVLPSLGWGAITGAAIGLGIGIYEVTVEKPIGPILGEDVAGGMILGAGLGCIGASLSYLRTKRGSDYTVGAGLGAIAGAAAGTVLAFYEAAHIVPQSQQSRDPWIPPGTTLAAVPLGADDGGLMLVGTTRF